MSLNLLVDPEFKTLIPPLDPNELKELEESILEEGCRDALVVWKETNTLLDGHNRLQICERVGKPYQIKLISLPDRDAAKVWIINNQFARRNLSPYQRSVLALRLEELISAQALSKKAEQMRAMNNAKTREWIKSHDPVSAAIVDILENQRTERRIHVKPNRIYVVVDSKESRAKIGCATDPSQRVKEDIKKHIPWARIVTQFYGDRTIEAQIHKHLEQYRLNNEWFQWNDEVAKSLQQFLDLSGIRQIETAEQLDALRSAAEVAQVSRDTIAKVKVIEEKATPEQKAKLVIGKATVNQVYIQVRRQEVKEQIKQTQWPTGKYRIIYADPPWQYSNSQPDYQTVQDDHYPTMPLNDICRLPVGEISLDDAVLFLWATSPILEDAFKVINAWGFKYKASFVWDKVKHNMGHYNSVRHEFLLIAVRGSCQPDNLKLFDSVQTVERTDHSAKPDVFRTIIDTLYPYGKRIELFARAKSDGWEQYGNQIS